MYSARLENEETLPQAIFDAFQITRFCPGTFETVRHCVITRVDACIVSAARYFENFLMNYDLINNKNSTFIQFGTCNVEVFCRLYVKYDTVTICTVECNFAIKLKNHTFSVLRFYELFLYNTKQRNAYFLN